VHSNWEYVPAQWRQEIRDRVNIFYVSPFHYDAVPESIRNDVRIILAQSISFGNIQWLKSYIVIRQAIKWHRLNIFAQYDYLLSYWGNYAATYAYLCDKLVGGHIPYSFFLHAGTDLYRDQIYLREKINYSSNIFTVCEFNKNFLSRLYPDDFSSFKDKIVLHHLGLDLENFELNTNNNSNILLTVGRLEKVKGFEYAIHALSIVLKKFPSVQLHMIGEGEEKKIYFD
jgi:glycosyltransferase involved in cell wall biosynthesis